MAVDHYENFPVSSLLCPPALRQAVTAIYAFARTADDIADEGDASVAQRLADLAAYRADLEAALSHGACGSRWPHVFDALSQAHRRHHLPAAPLRDLLSAFEQDVHNPSYPDRGALLDYCRRSANPVGRLMLHLYGENRPGSLAQSDSICTALQLINFWQDLGVDLKRGRNYLPTQELVAHGAAPSAASALVMTGALRETLRTLCDWAGAMMREGAPLALRLPGRAGWELRLVVQGGLRVIDKIRRIDYDTLQRRPTLGKADLPLLLLRAARMHG